MSTDYHSVLREKLAARHQEVEKHRYEIIPVSPTGQISDEPGFQLEYLAHQAKQGDVAVRDALYFSLQPRLQRVGFILRPWPDTEEQIGLWDRDDVQQESWLIFNDLLNAWNESTPFVTFLLARFAWRLRDKILRGIGKSHRFFGITRVPQEMLADILLASEFEQPESALLARKLLEALLLQMIRKNSADDALATPLLRLAHAREPRNIASLIDFPGKDTSDSNRDAA